MSDASPLFEDAHRRILPTRLDSGASEALAAEVRDLPPLAFRNPRGAEYTYRVRRSALVIEDGVDAAAVLVEISDQDWVGLWDASQTVFGLLMAGRIEIKRGSQGDLVQWENALRALYENLPLYDPAQPLVDAAGKEVDPTTTFHTDDDPARMSEFLRLTGFILVREVLTSSEINDLNAAADDAYARASKAPIEDPKSWWSKDAAGADVLTRVLDGESDPRMEALPTDPRLLDIVGLSPFDMEATRSNGISILYKASGLTFDGKADQPWHRDCGLGGHRFMCPLMNGSLFLSPATRESGELRFLPGSWRTAGRRLDVMDWDQGISVSAGPGDFSLHYGDGLHAGTPPTAPKGPFRRSLVFEYGPRDRADEHSQAQYDQLMLKADAAPLHRR